MGCPERPVDLIDDSCGCGAVTPINGQRRRVEGAFIRKAPGDRNDIMLPDLSRRDRQPANHRGQVLNGHRSTARSDSTVVIHDRNGSDVDVFRCVGRIVIGVNMRSGERP